MGASSFGQGRYDAVAPRLVATWSIRAASGLHGADDFHGAEEGSGAPVKSHWTSFCSRSAPWCLVFATTLPHHLAVASHRCLSDVGSDRSPPVQAFDAFNAFYRLGIISPSLTHMALARALALAPCFSCCGQVASRTSLQGPLRVQAFGPRRRSATCHSECARARVGVSHILAAISSVVVFSDDHRTQSPRGFQVESCGSIRRYLRQRMRCCVKQLM